MPDRAANPPMFARRFWPDGPPSTLLPDPAHWERLPTVTRLRSPAIAGMRQGGTVFEIGWNGCWVKARSAATSEA